MIEELLKTQARKTSMQEMEAESGNSGQETLSKCKLRDNKAKPYLELNVMYDVK